MREPSILEENVDKILENRAFTAKHMSEENMPPLERLILELRGTGRALYGQRTLLFWMLILSLLAHILR